jgi:hypothetical protein
MQADVCVRQVLIAIANRDCLVLVMEDVHARSEVDGVHKLRTLRTQRSIIEVDESSIGGEKRLHLE